MSVKMTKPMITIIDVITNDEQTREMNDLEYAAHLSMLEEQKNNEIAATIKAEAKAALLERLGITADEAALLLA